MDRVIYTETDQAGRITALLFFCPGCKCAHLVPIVPGRPGFGVWSWNGSMDAPTFRPSILNGGKSVGSNIKNVCHSYVTDGQIQFLGDSTHELAGKTVALELF